MRHPWSAELSRVAVWFGVAALIGWMLGYSLEAIGVAFLGYLAWNLRNLYRLERWLRSARRFHPPEAIGIWGEVFHLLYHQQQRNRSRRRKLAAILNRFQEATAAVPDATVVLGVHDEIQWFNDAAQEMLGLHTGQDIGQRVQNLIRYPQFVDFIAHGNEAGYILIPSPEDETVTLSVRSIPYSQDQRLLILRDVSQQQRLEQMRRDFVANVSHELRTPLTVVSGFLETMLDEDDEFVRQWHRSLVLMQQQTQRMHRIVEDLLLLSRLETDRSGPPHEVVDVPAVLTNIREEAQQLARDKEHRIELECAPGLGLYGSRHELQSAFTNLVTNAVRYTPSGGSITLRWYADPTGGAHYEVIDTGIGIERQHLPRLTERFYRVDVGRSRESGGTGLGLAIVKHVLSRHEGRLEVRSTPGRGSTFSCHFPRQRVVAPSRDALAEP